jgi:hypothetical protein
VTAETVDAEDGTSDEVDTEALRSAFDRDDPTLSPAEKETTFRFARDEDRVTFYTTEAGVGRRLIAHPEAVLDGVVVRDGDARPTLPPEEVTAGEHVVGVGGTLPIGAFSIKSEPRKSDRHAPIVSERVLDDEGGGGDA